MVLCQKEIASKLLESEAATLNYVRNSGIPVSHVHSYS